MAPQCAEGIRPGPAGFAALAACVEFATVLGPRGNCPDIPYGRINPDH
jgi:hypothetical protein